MFLLVATPDMACLSLDEMDPLSGLFMCIFPVLRVSSSYGLHCASRPFLL